MKCQLCGHDRPVKFLDLGLQPLANKYPTAAQFETAREMLLAGGAQMVYHFMSDDDVDRKDGIRRVSAACARLPCGLLAVA